MILELFLDNNVLSIKLLENNFVYSWANYIKELPLNETEKMAWSTKRQCRDKILFYKKITELCDLLKVTSATFNIEIPKEFETNPDNYDCDDLFKTQHQMNIIHRWVVYSCHGFKYFIDNTKTIEQVKENELHLPGNSFWWLNKAVHNVEEVSPSPNQWKWSNHIRWDQDFIFKNINLERGFWDEKNNHLFTTKNHDLWLGQRILGKDYREAWMDNDDPSSLDITNLDINHGWSFELDPLNNLENFYSDPIILDWLNRYNVPINQKTLGRVPLGNIIDKNNYDWNNIMQNNKIIKLKLHE